MTDIIRNTSKDVVPVPNQDDFPRTGYVRVKQILAPSGPLPISKSGFWAGVKNGKFPQPRKISAKVTVWRAEDIRDLMARIDSGQI